MSLKTLCEYLDQKKIAIWGLGREGRSSLKFIEEHQDLFRPRSIYLADQHQPEETDSLRVWLEREEVQGFFGDQQREALADADLVLMSPGIAVLDQGISLRDGFYRFESWPQLEVTSQMDLFLRHSPGHLIGVTGTKGKSTTTTVLASMLEHAGIDTKLIGNIGVPVWDALPTMTDESYAAIELSSHQLQFACGTPEALIVTNLYPEHLDHYHSYDAYVDAKLNALRHSSEAWASSRRNGRVMTLVLNLEDKDLVRRAMPLIEATGAQVAAIATDEVHFSRFGAAQSEWLFQHDKLYSRTEPETAILDLGGNAHLLGVHLRYDAAMAATALIAMGIDPERLQEGIVEYPGLPHRTQYIGTFREIAFYNDSIATIPQATRLAVEALGERVETLVLGGMDRGLDMTGLIDWLTASQVKRVLLMPDTGYAIAKLLDERRQKDPAVILEGFIAETMEEVARLSFDLTEPGGIVLLSPAASSYNVYKNFEERGLHFEAAVREEAQRRD